MLDVNINTSSSVSQYYCAVLCGLVRCWRCPNEMKDDDNDGDDDDDDGDDDDNIGQVIN